MDRLDVLRGFTDRQVVLNVYREGELLEKSGFSFGHIELSADRIAFVRDGRAVEELKLEPGFRFVRLPDFPRFYAVEQGGVRTELYFP